jgi:DNA-binding NarL/FixJ family response regulator
MTSYIARKVVQSFHRAEQQLPNPEPHGLTQREWQILELLARGQYYKQIADNLGITVLTVNTHIRRIYDKLHVRSRGQAVAKYASFPFRPLTGGGQN